MKVNIKGFIVPKTSEKYSDCRDNYAVDITNHKFAIADGVSKSFFPGIWSELLVNSFADAGKEVEMKQLVKDCQTEWFKKVKEIVQQPNQKYYVTNKFIKKEPGLSTFVGLEFFERDKQLVWKAIAIGDSFLFFLPKGYEKFDDDLISLSSKEDFEFDNFPDYYCSIGDKHKGKPKIIEKVLKEGTFYLMTDALAEWFINDKEEAVKYISNWQTQDNYKSDITELRKLERLGNDDTAILVIDIEKKILEKVPIIKNLINVELNYTNSNINSLQELIIDEERKRVQQENNSKIEKIKKEQEDLLQAEIQLKKDWKHLERQKEELKVFNKKIEEEEKRIESEKVRIQAEAKRYNLSELNIKKIDKSQSQGKNVKKTSSEKQNQPDNKNTIEPKKPIVNLKQGEKKVKKIKPKSNKSKNNDSTNQTKDVLNKI